MMIPCFALLVLVGTAAGCDAERIGEEFGGAGEGEPVVPEAAVPERGSETDLVRQRIDVLNRLPYPMEVYVTRDAERRRLGRIAARDSGTFQVRAARDAEVELVARDTLGERSVTDTIIAGRTPKTWQLEP